MHRLAIKAFSLLSAITLLTSCGNGSGSDDRINYGKPARLGSLPSYTERNAQIKAEPKGDFFYGRRYFVDKTRFWGYIRKPGESWDSAQLSIINEDHKHQPDRLPEDNPPSRRYGYDQNYDYQLFGTYTGKKILDPNSNLFLPEFKLTGYKLLNKKPGWIFSPRDYYAPKKITLRAY